jgi:hypothetical protein
MAHLNSGRSITQLEAIQEYSLFRLPVIIESLRVNYGMTIWTEMRTAANGTRYGRYSITNPNENNPTGKFLNAWC